MNRFIRDDFAGPGGWSQGLRLLGLRETVGVEFEASAVRTARAAGHSRWEIDATSPECRFYPWPPLWLYIASPPCQTFSMAGGGSGRRHMGAILDALHRVAAGELPEDAVEAVDDEELDVRTVLVLEPMRVIVAHRPANIAMEQVPPVLPIWQEYAEILRRMGYSAWTGMIRSEQQGVPQTRKRAVLMASLEREVAPPVPTHSRFYSRSPEKLDDGVLPWVSMAQALGWGMTSRPSMTVTGGGSSTGGAEPFGNAARRAIQAEATQGRWALQGNQKPGGSDGYQQRDIDLPAQTITSMTSRYQFVQSAQSKATRRDLEHPAPTITGGHDANDRQFVQVSNYSAPGPAGATAAERGRAERPAALPSTATTSEGSRQAQGRPSVVTRVTVQEAGVLQGFPRDYPWYGTQGQQFQQAGNAVPPQMAAAILAALLGIDPTSPPPAT